MNRHERGVGVENSAARKTHDVVQEAMEPALVRYWSLISRIDVYAIGRGDDARCRLVVLLGPAANLDLLRYRH